MLQKLIELKDKMNKFKLSKEANDLKKLIAIASGDTEGLSPYGLQGSESFKPPQVKIDLSEKLICGICGSDDVEEPYYINRKTGEASYIGSHDSGGFDYNGPTPYCNNEDDPRHKRAVDREPFLIPIAERGKWIEEEKGDGWDDGWEYPFDAKDSAEKQREWFTDILSDKQMSDYAKEMAKEQLAKL